MRSSGSYSRARLDNPSRLASSASIQLYIQSCVDFDWDSNREHVLDHRVEPDEVEEALVDPRRIGAPAYRVREEQRWAALGATEDGASCSSSSRGETREYESLRRATRPQGRDVATGRGESERHG